MAKSAELHRIEHERREQRHVRLLGGAGRVGRGQCVGAEGEAKEDGARFSA